MVGRLVDLCRQRNGFSGPENRQVAGDLEGVLTRSLDPGRFERDGRVLGRIEEIATSQMLVELRDTAIDARRVDRDLDRAVLGVAAVELKLRVKAVEAQARIRETQVAVGKGDVAVRAVECVLARRHVGQIGRNAEWQSEQRRGTE